MSLLLTPAFCVAIAACGGGDKPLNSGEQPPPTCPPGQSFNGQVCVSDGTQPSPTATTTGSAPQPSTPPDPNAVAAASAALDALAKQSAPAGAAPVGSVITGQLATGQSVEAPLQLQPGKCYTVFGGGIPPVQEVNLQILPVAMIPAAPGPVLAQDQNTGPMAVLGAEPHCFKWAPPFPAPVRVVLTVAAGQGAVAMQIYEK
jgi:hypothetical protein